MIMPLIQAEGMKMRKICWWLPAIQAAILIVMTALEWYLYFRQGPGGVYAGFAVMFMFLSFVILLGNTLLASILAGVEHDAHAWKQIITMPVRRYKIYVAKAVWLVMLQLITVIITIAGMVIIWLLYTNEPIPWKIMLLQPLNACLASLPVLAIQLWLSVTFPNQAVPLAIGIFGAIGSLFLARASATWIHWLPWSYPSRSTPLGPDYMTWVIVGLCIGAVLIMLGSIQFSRKQFN